MSRDCSRPFLDSKSPPGCDCSRPIQNPKASTKRTLSNLKAPAPETVPMYSSAKNDLNQSKRRITVIQQNPSNR